MSGRKSHSSGVGISLDQMKKELLNLCMYGVREGVKIDDTLPDGKGLIVEQGGEKVGFIVNAKHAEELRQLANRRRE